MIDIQFVQTLQDFFAKTMDVALIFIYKNNWLTDASNTCSFCREYTRRNNLLNKRCGLCHKHWETVAKQQNRPVIFDCHIGIKNFAVPITIDNNYVGCVIGGQVLTEAPDVNYFRSVAQECGIDEDEYILALKDVKIIPNEKVKATTELLFLLANSFAAIAYANYKLNESGIDYKIPRNIELERWFLDNYGRIKKPISSREYEVLKLIVQGKSNVEIAKELFISVHTAKAHVSSILEKFKVNDRVQVAVKAVREGLI